MNKKSQRTKNTLLQVAQGNRTNQNLQESIFSPTQEKLKNKKSPPLQKNKTSCHRTVQTLTDTASNVNFFGQSVCGLVTSTHRTDRRASGNSGFKKLAVQWLNEHLCFVSSSVLADSLVLRNRQLLKPAKRKLQCYWILHDNLNQSNYANNKQKDKTAKCGKSL